MVGCGCTRNLRACGRPARLEHRCSPCHQAAHWASRMVCSCPVPQAPPVGCGESCLKARLWSCSGRRLSAATQEQSCRLWQASTVTCDTCPQLTPVSRQPRLRQEHRSPSRLQHSLAPVQECALASLRLADTPWSRLELPMPLPVLACCCPTVRLRDPCPSDSSNRQQVLRTRAPCSHQPSLVGAGCEGGCSWRVKQPPAYGAMPCWSSKLFRQKRCPCTAEGMT